jgi:hypothetical protein
MMRSLLFVPATGGAMLDKAMASGADGVILDLEKLNRRGCWCASTAWTPA